MEGLPFFDEILSEFRENVQKILDITSIEIYRDIICQNLQIFSAISETEKVTHYSMHCFIGLLPREPHLLVGAAEAGGQGGLLLLRRAKVRAELARLPGKGLGVRG